MPWFPEGLTVFPGRGAQCLPAPWNWLPGPTSHHHLPLAVPKSELPNLSHFRFLTFQVRTITIPPTSWSHCEGERRLEMVHGLQLVLCEYQILLLSLTCLYDELSKVTYGPLLSAIFYWGNVMLSFCSEMLGSESLEYFPHEFQGCILLFHLTCGFLILGREEVLLSWCTDIHQHSYNFVFISQI